MKFLRYLYLGFALAAFANLNIDSWQYWIIVLPLALMDLNKVKKDEKL